MGMLSDGAGADISSMDNTGPGVGVSEEIPEVADGAPAADAALDTAPRTERVVVPGRRAAAAEKRSNIEKQIEALTNTVKESATAYQARVSALEAENARIRGGFDVLAPLLQQRQAPAVAAPDAQSLFREAKKALDANDFDEYQRLSTEAMRTDIMSKLPAQQPQQQQSGTNPVVQALLVQHPGVLNAGQRGIDLAINKDNELAIMGMVAGPERFRKAFELAQNALGTPASASYSQDSRGVLSGVPPARSSGGVKGGTGETGVHLTDFELRWAEAAGMKKEEYAAAIAASNPKRLG